MRMARAAKLVAAGGMIAGAGALAVAAANPVVRDTTRRPVSPRPPSRPAGPGRAHPASAPPRPGRPPAGPGGGLLPGQRGGGRAGRAAAARLDHLGRPQLLHHLRRPLPSLPGGRPGPPWPWTRDAIRAALLARGLRRRRRRPARRAGRGPGRGGRILHGRCGGHAPGPAASRAGVGTGAGRHGPGLDRQPPGAGHVDGDEPVRGGTPQRHRRRPDRAHPAGRHRGVPRARTAPGLGARGAQSGLSHRPGPGRGEPCPPTMDGRWLGN